MKNRFLLAPDNAHPKETTEIDKFFLRQTIELSKKAVQHGNYPFGAMLVDEKGKVLLECENTINTGNNLTEHAEMNLIKTAVKTFDKATLTTSTIYASCQPHIMSLGAMHWAKIGKLVYALSSENLNKNKNSTEACNPREVFSLYEKSFIKVEGPVLEDDANEPHKGFWRTKENTINNQNDLTNEAALSDREVSFLKEAIKISEESVKHGNHPFGAVLVDAKGNILLKIENTAHTSHDVTQHAEMNAVGVAVKTIDKSTLAGSTLFSSCEPCAMCLGALHVSCIGKVVYALSHDNLDKYSSNNTESTVQVPGKYSCRQINGLFQRSPVMIKGPFCEDEASVPHAGFWNRK